MLIINELQSFCKLLATLLRHILHVFTRSWQRKRVFYGRKISFYVIFSIFGFTINCSTQVSQSLTVNASCNLENYSPQKHSANFVCKVNDFFWLYAHSARFSCRMCLLFNIFRRIGNSSCHYWLQLKEKRMDLAV